jgi:hypothetical protein
MKQSLDVIAAFRYGLLGTRDGRLAFYGSLIQVPFVLFYAWQAIAAPLATPQPAKILLVHLSAVAGLLFGWLWFGLLVRYKNSSTLVVYLVLVAAMPFVARLTT